MTIQSRAPSAEYRDGWDRVFGMRRSALGIVHYDSAPPTEADFEALIWVAPNGDWYFVRGHDCYQSVDQTNLTRYTAQQLVEKYQMQEWDTVTRVTFMKALEISGRVTPDDLGEWKGGKFV